MSISIKTRQAYSEIDEFLGLLTLEKQNQIPKKLRDFFKEEKDKYYVKHINPNISIKEQNLLKETLAIIALLNLQYWCKDEQEKQKLKQIYAENEKKYQEQLREKYNPDNIFKKPNNNENEEIKVNNQEQQIAIYKESFVMRFFNKILKFFHKN